jgi:hypothetical protein
MGLFGKARSAIDKLAEEKAKIELKMIQTPKVLPKTKSTRMVDESAEEYGHRLTQHRRKGLY